MSPNCIINPRCISNLKCTVSVSITQEISQMQRLGSSSWIALVSLPSTPQKQLQSCVQLLLSAFIPLTTFCKYCACAHMRTRRAAKTNGIRCCLCNHLANENTKQPMLQSRERKRSNLSVGEIVSPTSPPTTKNRLLLLSCAVDSVCLSSLCFVFGDIDSWAVSLRQARYAPNKHSARLAIPGE